MTIAELELSRLAVEHQKVLRAVRRSIDRLQNDEPTLMTEAIITDLNIAMAYRVGDTGVDRILSAVGATY